MEPMQLLHLISCYYYPPMPLPAKKETRTKGENWMGYCDFFIMAVWWMCLYALQYEANLVYSCNSVVIEIL
jgi:hypothetical protein